MHHAEPLSEMHLCRRLYEAVGLGWVYAITKNPVIGRAAEWWAAVNTNVAVIMPSSSDMS